MPDLFLSFSQGGQCMIWMNKESCFVNNIGKNMLYMNTWVILEFPRPQSGTKNFKHAHIKDVLYIKAACNTLTSNVAL